MGGVPFARCALCVVFRGRCRCAAVALRRSIYLPIPPVEEEGILSFYVAFFLGGRTMISPSFTRLSPVFHPSFTRLSPSPFYI
jgi:hypothetical protein